MNDQDWFMLIAGALLCVTWVADVLFPPPRARRLGR